MHPAPHAEAAGAKEVSNSNHTVQIAFLRAEVASLTKQLVHARSLGDRELCGTETSPIVGGDGCGTQSHIGILANELDAWKRRAFDAQVEQDRLRAQIQIAPLACSSFLRCKIRLAKGRGCCVPGAGRT